MKRFQLIIIAGLVVFFLIAVVVILGRFGRIVSFFESLNGQEGAAKAAFVAGIEYGVGIAIQLGFMLFLISLFRKIQRGRK